MKLQDIVSSITDFSAWSHVQKIRFFAWYIHSYRNQERFNQADIRAYYDELYLDKPSNVSPYLAQLRDRKPKEVVQDKGGYYLVRQVREQFELEYGQRQTAIQVERLLLELPDKVSDLAEQVFLQEAIACFRCGAFRAAIVMSWNLAFDHLCNYVMKLHLTAFNTQLPLNYPKSRITAIATRDDFNELKEFEVIEICKSARIISGNVQKILQEKLKRRNIAAHPSSEVILQFQAEDFITDLVNNIVLKLV
ncbi:hypothetical protein H6F53_23820 [Trichocoleus sp. FACHB-832]|uniref:hypothetical protein n=1 Tax=Trichocoleus sp. FACHB-832 TaxID=2692875 RepID=UPI001686BDD7|nr:hypothetical protein [Trichocoleus sp. FACHB-832]MBD1908478.1 hypothetical protein [Trichocoleus sp. FACHB-832]